jgi:hemolysin-activating ACP:hemolysin acyltransferase
MLADFGAVEPFEKIAIRVLPQRGSMCVSFWIDARPEFFCLGAIVDANASRDQLNQARKLSVHDIR